MSSIKAEKLLKLVRELLEEEGVSISKSEDQSKIVKEYILPAINKSKDIQGELYKEFTYESTSKIKSMKNKILRKLGNITRNVVEKPLMKQQKFNNNVYLTLEYLLEENIRLKADLEKNSNE